MFVMMTWMPPNTTWGVNGICHSDISVYYKYLEKSVCLPQSFSVGVESFDSIIFNTLFQRIFLRCNTCRLSLAMVNKWSSTVVLIELLCLILYVSPTAGYRRSFPWQLSCTFTMRVAAPPSHSFFLCWFCLCFFPEKMFYPCYMLMILLTK